MLEELSLMNNKGSQMFKERQIRVERFIYESHPDVFHPDSMVGISSFGMLPVKTQPLMLPLNTSWNNTFPHILPTHATSPFLVYFLMADSEHLPFKIKGIPIQDVAIHMLAWSSRRMLSYLQPYPNDIYAFMVKKEKPETTLTRGMGRIG